MKKDRIDKILYELGYADSIAKAQALVMSGAVLINEKRVEKPSELAAENVNIRIKGLSPESKYASRGGLKLEKALGEFNISVDGRVCIDVGSSTGGFTDCLLKHGAAKVIAIDSGTNQLAWSLRSDPRVEVRENTNARNLKPKNFDEQLDLAVIDVSFISVTKIMPAIIPLLKATGKLVVLIKPQFEVGKDEVGKGGIVREPEKHEKVLSEINNFAAGIGLKISGMTESPILGSKGNKEFLVLYERK